jgi:hypothetical protein
VCEVTFEELEGSLPNGLHDATLDALHVDYRHRKIVLNVQIDVGPAMADAEVYRAARLVFHDTQFVIVEPPGNEDGGIPSMIDMGLGQPSTVLTAVPVLKTGAFLVWVFLAASNSFILIAARDIALEWLDEAPA